MLSNDISNLEFLLSINPEKAVKDDVKNPFITNHVIPLIKKVEFWYIYAFITELWMTNSYIIKILLGI
jgi:hypothetical protein